MELPLGLPRDRLELRRPRPPPDCSRPGGEPTSASTSASMSAARERARELERRGRPRPLATATVQAPRGLEASRVSFPAGELAA